MIAVSIIALVQGLMVTSWRGQILKGNDAARKGDLSHIKTAFEEYYNDNACYPALTALSTCGSPALSPYLSKSSLRSDDQTAVSVFGARRRCLSRVSRFGKIGKQVRSGHNNARLPWGSGVRIWRWVQLRRFLRNGRPCPRCTDTDSDSGADGSAHGSPHPDSHAGAHLLCLQSAGICNIYSDPVGSGCPITFPNPQCSNACDVVGNRCQK